ncbi:unnamed protein product [Peniophora sp. CBMAI 1063]|nr:unnamed protein product [Peniophora sp. CBMAI 1063]
MGSTCLSLVPVLRCIGLTRLESGLLLIPAGLELIFSLGLIVAGRGQGRRRYLLAAEGIFYLFLAVLDVLTHEIPMFSSSLSSFRNLDIFIGATSFIPILLFTGFLYIFKRTEFFPYFPRRFVFVAHTFALVVIPVLLATNEVGSFIGNNYTVVQFPTGPQFAVGTRNGGAETARVFFNSFSLALMATYSVVTFLVFFVRLASSFVRQKEIEDKGGMQEETYLFKGTGWVALGMALSAAEAFVGFADGSFGIYLTRRILRMVGRACVIIGVVKGPDRHLRFEMMDSEKDSRRVKRNTTLRLQIGNPMLVSSSARLSNLPAVDLAPPRSASILSATAVGTAPLMAGGMVQFPSMPRPLSRYRPSGERADVSSMDTTRRVTVSLGRNRAPTLILRLSDTNLPSPSIFMPPRGRGSNRNSDASNHYSLRNDPEAFARFQARREADDRVSSPAFAYSPGRPLTYNPGEPQRPTGSLLRSHWSSSGVGIDPPSPHRPGIRDSLRRASALFGRIARFPLPPKEQARSSYQGTEAGPPYAPRTSGDDLMRRSSSRRKPVPPVRASMFEDATGLLDRDNFTSPVTPGDQYPAIPDSAGLRRVPESSREDVTSMASPESVTSGQWIAAYPRSRSLTASTSLMPAPKTQDQAINDPNRSLQSLEPANASGGSELPGPLSAAANEHAANMDWLSNPDLADDAPDTAFQAARAHARTSSQAMPLMLTRAVRPPSANPSQTSLVTPRPGGTPSRQLSFGTVMRRTTPEPSSTPVRGSVAPEHDSIDMIDSVVRGDSDADSDIIDFSRLQPTQEEEDASERALEDESIAGSPTSLLRQDSAVLPRDLDEARRRRASQLTG